MKKVASMGVELTNEERNLFSVAVKNVVGTRRSALRVLSAILPAFDDDNNNDDQRMLVEDYSAVVKDEMVNICNEVLVCFARK